MKRNYFLQCLTVSASVAVAGCSSSDNDNDSSDQSALNEDAPQAENTGEPGGEIPAIAGLWNGSTPVGETLDEIFWNLDGEGILTRYDYQQDGLATSTGENCYIVGDPITVTPEDDDTYSFFNVAVTAVRNDDELTITFIDEDKNDLDEDGDVTETPTYNWTLSTSPSLDDLNVCAPVVTEQESGDEELVDPDTDTDTPPVVEDVDISKPPTPPGGGLDNEEDELPVTDDAVYAVGYTNDECAAEGGTVVGDIGNGAIFEPEFRCESGLKPIGYIYSLEGEPVATDGAVCCK